MIYRIKGKKVNEPLVELPKDSQVVSVEHQWEREYRDKVISFAEPESWTVVYLEPVLEKGK